MSQDATPVFVRGNRSRAKRESKKLSFILYEALFGPIVFLKAAYRQLIILLGMFIWGAVIFSYFEHLPPVAALLASVSTITTIGLYVPNGGVFSTMNETEAILLIVMIVVSVGTGASLLQSTVNTVVNGDFARSEAEKRIITRLKRHVIVFGYNHLGKYVIDKLESLGLDYVVVTKDSQVYQDLLKKEVLVVLESETQPIDALKAAGIQQAAIVIVAHSNDPDNMLFILSAKKLRPEVRIVSVVHNDSLIETAKNAGAEVVIPSSVTVGHLLALSATTKDLVGIVFSERIGTKEIAQFSVFPSSKLIGKGLEEVSKYAVIIGVVRNDQVVRDMFARDFRVQASDVLLVLGDPSALSTLEEEAKAT